MKIAPVACDDRSAFRTTLTERGFVQVRDALDPIAIEELRERLLALVTGDRTIGTKALGSPQVIESTRLLRRHRELRHHRVFSTCHDLASHYFGRRARYCFDHAIFKRPGDSSEVRWHQDQAYQNFDLEMRSIHFWIPLQTTDVHNGGMEYAVGSHDAGRLQHSRSRRGDTLELRSDPDQPTVAPRTPIGDILAHLPLTVHRSSRNRGTSTRGAWILHFSPYGKLEAFRPHNLALHLRRMLVR